MKVVLLCGGIGRRMFPLTEDKFLLRFLGKTLLEHQLKLAKEAGLTDFIIVGNSQNIGSMERITANISNITVEFAVQKNPLGMADALRNARQFLDGEIIVINPNDIFESFAYKKILDAYHDQPAISYLLGYEVADYFPGGYLITNDDGNLTGIMEKPEKGKEPSNLVNLVVHLHRDPQKLLQYAESVQTKQDDIYECAIDAMVKDAYRIKVVPYTGFWSSVKYPWHILTLAQWFLDRGQRYISPSAYISEKATIEGKVVIDDNVKILENAVIRGPVYIGPNSIIGNNSLVRDYSHIGADCVVGYSTEIKGSYIGDKCHFHMNYIGDSVIGADCSFGAGTIVGNLRFDERNVSVRVGKECIDTGRKKFGAIIGGHSRTGINVSTMPGIKIGPNSIVGPNVCLTSDLEPDSFIMAEQVSNTTRNRFRC